MFAILNVKVAEVINFWKCCSSGGCCFAPFRMQFLHVEPMCEVGFFPLRLCNHSRGLYTTITADGGWQWLWL